MYLGPVASVVIGAVPPSTVGASGVCGPWWRGGGWLARESAATWSLVLPWLWEEWKLGFKEQCSPAGISDTHLLVQVQLGPIVLAVTGSEAGVGDIW